MSTQQLLVPPHVSPQGASVRSLDLDGDGSVSVITTGGERGLSTGPLLDELVQHPAGPAGPGWGGR
jgi:hypothetical protein